jgi:hypothetical protein
MRLISFYEIVNILSLSLSLFSYEGFRGELIVSWLQHNQKTLDWALGTRFSVYMKRLIDGFPTRADLSPLITFNQLQIYDIWYQRQTIRPTYIVSPNSLPTSTVYKRRNLDKFLNVRIAADLENMT